MIIIKKKKTKQPYYLFILANMWACVIYLLEMKRLLTGTKVLTGYGQTETRNITEFNLFDAEDQALARAKSQSCTKLWIVSIIKQKRFWWVLTNPGKIESNLRQSWTTLGLFFCLEFGRLAKNWRRRLLWQWQRFLLLHSWHKELQRLPCSVGV